MLDNQSNKDMQFLWERYKYEVELHRSYLDLVIKINTFYYAITGAVVSFYFLHIHSEPLVKYSLILPFFMTLALAIFYWRCANAAEVSQGNIDKLAQNLQFDVGSVIAKILANLLRIFSVMFVITALGLLFLFLKDALLCFMEKLNVW